MTPKLSSSHRCVSTAKDRRSNNSNNNNRSVTMKLAQASHPILVRNDRSLISALTMPTCLGCKEHQGDESTLTNNNSDEDSSTLFTGLETETNTNIIGPSSAAAAAPCWGNTDAVQTIDDEVDTRSFPYDRRKKERME